VRPKERVVANAVAKWFDCWQVANELARSHIEHPQQTVKCMPSRKIDEKAVSN